MAVTGRKRTLFYCKWVISVYLRQATCFYKLNYMKLELMLMDYIKLLIKIIFDLLFSMLLMFTNMYTVTMVTVLFPCNWYVNKYYFKNFNTNSCW